MSLDSLDDDVFERIVSLVGQDYLLQTVNTFEAVSRRYRTVVRKQILPNWKCVSFKGLRHTTRTSDQCRALLSFIERCSNADKVDMHGSWGFAGSSFNESFFLSLLTKNKQITHYSLDYCADIPPTSIMALFEASHITHLSLRSLANDGTCIKGSVSPTTFHRVISFPLYRMVRSKMLHDIDFSWCRSINNMTIKNICSLSVKRLSLQGCEQITQVGTSNLQGGFARGGSPAGNTIEHLNIAFLNIRNAEILRLAEQCPNLRTIALASKTNNTWNTGRWTKQGLEQALQANSDLRFEFI